MMARKDIVQTGAWAAATAVVALGLVIGHTAVGDDEAKRQTGPVVVVDGLRITVTATPSQTDPQRTMLDVAVENPTDKAITLGSKVTLVRQEYSGDPFSRVAVPTDYKRVTIASKKLHGVYPPGKTRTVRLTDVRPSVADAPASRKADVRPAPAGGVSAPRAARTMRSAPPVTYGIAVLDESGRLLPASGVRPTSPR